MTNIALDLLPHSIRVCIYTPTGGVSCEIDAEGARALALAMARALALAMDRLLKALEEVGDD